MSHSLSLSYALEEYGPNTKNITTNREFASEWRFATGLKQKIPLKW